MIGTGIEIAVVALAAAQQKLNSQTHFILSILIQLGAAYAVSLIIYQIGRLLL